jgi:hypothetical protein
MPQAVDLKGPAYTYISEFDHTWNGPEAVKSLIVHYEGESALSRTKQTAYDDVNNLTYGGERLNLQLRNMSTDMPEHIKRFRSTINPWLKARRWMISCMGLLIHHQAWLLGKQRFCQAR